MWVRVLTLTLMLRIYCRLDSQMKKSRRYGFLPFTNHKNCKVNKDQVFTFIQPSILGVIHEIKAERKKSYLLEVLNHHMHSLSCSFASSISPSSTFHPAEILDFSPFTHSFEYLRRSSQLYTHRFIETPSNPRTSTCTILYAQHFHNPTLLRITPQSSSHITLLVLNTLCSNK